MFDLVAPLPNERVFHGSAQVRLGDSSPGGRARLDALARLLQDVADDDARHAGFGHATWVVRRTVIAVHRFPTYLEHLSLSTWCAGFGAAWAERRITVRGEGGGYVESATLWVHMDSTSMRPSRLPKEFLEVFGPSAGGRSVSAKPVLQPCPSEAATSTAVPWPVRFSDFDVLEHVNNAVYLAPVEEALATRRSLRAPMTVVVEHGDPIERDVEVRWVVADHSAGGPKDEPAAGFDAWLVGAPGADGAGCRQFAAVRVTPGV